MGMIRTGDDKGGREIMYDNEGRRARGEGERGREGGGGRGRAREARSREEGGVPHPPMSVVRVL